MRKRRRSSTEVGGASSVPFCSTDREGGIDSFLGCWSVTKKGLQDSNNSLQRLICVSSSSVVTLLGSVLQDPGELVVVEHAVLDRRLPVHLVNIVVREPIADRSAH